MGTDDTGARDSGAVVLGLEGFRLVAVDEHDGELELAVETTNDMVAVPAAARWPPRTDAVRCGSATCRWLGGPRA